MTAGILTGAYYVMMLSLNMSISTIPSYVMIIVSDSVN